MEKGVRDWGTLPPELIAMVMQKVEQGAGAPGEGRRLVAVAGVCRAWRRSVHDEERIQQSQTLLTFPAAINHRGSHMECMLKKTGGTFRLVQRRACGDEYFLLSARKKRTIRSSYFRISAGLKLLRTQEAVSTVRSNFWRTTFTVENPSMVLSVHFEEAAVDGNCQRKVRCELGPHAVRSDHKGEDVGWRPAWLITMLKWNKLTNPAYKSVKCCGPGSSSPDAMKSRSVNERMVACSLQNKDPDWHEQEQCWSLDFNSRASSIVASIHNFQLVPSDSSDHGRVVLQLGKVSKGLFVLDFGAPLSPLEAFAIALSSFATTVGLDP